MPPRAPCFCATHPTARAAAIIPAASSSYLPLLSPCLAPVTRNECGCNTINPPRYPSCTPTGSSRYFSVVENRRVRGGRVVQRHVLYLGEINSSQELAWRKSIEVLDEAHKAPRTLALFPED